MSGFEHGKHDANVTCETTVCDDWIMMRGLNSAAWALPGDADYNDTTYMTPY